MSPSSTRKAPNTQAASDQWNRRTSGSQTLTMSRDVVAFMAPPSVAAPLDDAAVGRIEIDLDVVAPGVLAIDLVALARDLELADDVAVLEQARLHRRFRQPLAARCRGAFRRGDRSK